MNVKYEFKDKGEDRLKGGLMEKLSDLNMTYLVHGRGYYFSSDFIGKTLKWNLATEWFWVSDKTSVFWRNKC